MCEMCWTQLWNQQLQKRVHFYVQIVEVGTVHKAKTQNLFYQKQQKSHADVSISCQKNQLDENISLKEQVSEIAHLKAEFLALRTE